MSALFRLNEKCWPLLVLALLAIVTIASLSPHMPAPGVMSSDKLRHFLSYAAIAGPIALARPRGWGPMLLALLGWSIAIELIQPYVGRSGDPRDFLANATGVGLGVFLAAGLRRVARAA